MSEPTPLSVEERYPIEIIQGVEGFCIGLNNYRIAGPKPWGGGTVVKRWDVSLADLGRAIPSIDAQATEIAALKGALENLMDEQNGPPLIRDAASWQVAMDNARRVLAQGV